MLIKHTKCNKYIRVIDISGPKGYFLKILRFQFRLRLLELLRFSHRIDYILDEIAVEIWLEIALEFCSWVKNSNFFCRRKKVTSTQLKG